MAIPQKPAEPPPQPNPVGQQALRQQRFQFFNPVINHARALMIAGRDGAGKPKKAAMPTDVFSRRKLAVARKSTTAD